MKYKKIITLIIIIITISIIGSITASAAWVWKEEEIWKGINYYKINMITFLECYYDYDLEEYFGANQKHSAYIRNHKHSYYIGDKETNIFYIKNSLYLEDPESWEEDDFMCLRLNQPAYIDGGYELSLLTFDYIYIDQGLYNIITARWGNIKIHDQEQWGGMETFFEATKLTYQPIIKDLNSWFIEDDGDISFLGFITATGVGIIATLSVIKLIKIKRKE